MKGGLPRHYPNLTLGHLLTAHDTVGQHICIDLSPAFLIDQRASNANTDAFALPEGSAEAAIIGSAASTSWRSRSVYFGRANADWCLRQDSFLVVERRRLIFVVGMDSV